MFDRKKNPKRKN